LSSPYFNADTIASIVTAPNAVAAVGVIRVSGPRAWDVASALLQNAPAPESVESHKLSRCTLVDEQGHSLDDAMFVWMKAPRSFTGEEVIELHLHGSPLLLRRAMQALQIAGARQAIAGEFSFRAFQNGKLSLDQAESVADLIASRSEEGARRALNHLLGKPRAEIAALKKELVDRLAEVEIDIDFSDQGVSIFQHEVWAKRLDAWVAKVEVIRAEFVRSQPLRDGIRLAFLGDPNSGKSSLFNRLLGEDRSIVSELAGTTRDVVRESISVGGLLFRLSDTAGIRETVNEIEAQGIERSLGEASSAHLVLWVFDGSRFKGGIAELHARIRGDAKIIAVWNKADVAGKPPLEWSSYFTERKIPAVSVSALNGQGIPELLEAVTGLFAVHADDQPDFWISRTRHYEVLGRASDSVRQALERVRGGEHFPDLLSADLRAALFGIGELTGEFTSDDLLNHIFAEFCIGK
jgi:tRNA modification GTPase